MEVNGYHQLSGYQHSSKYLQNFQFWVNYSFKTINHMMVRLHGTPFWKYYSSYTGPVLGSNWLHVTELRNLIINLIVIRYSYWEKCVIKLVTYEILTITKGVTSECFHTHPHTYRFNWFLSQIAIYSTSGWSQSKKKVLKSDFVLAVL